MRFSACLIFRSAVTLKAIGTGSGAKSSRHPRRVLHVMSSSLHFATAATGAIPELRSLSVAVIGGGAAGLAAARELHNEGHHRVVVYEQGDSIGGVWVYTDEAEDDPLGTNPTRKRQHSSMYRGLRTNLPREVMGFPDFPFDTKFPGSQDPRRFCGWEEVLRYLRAFAAHFGLERFLRFRTTVSRVAPVLPGSGIGGEPSSSWPQWQVDSVSTADGATATATSEMFDAVVVCNGHYSEPRVPEWPGQHTFPGQQIHSHNYRTPLPFVGKRVVVIGAAFSGVDCAQELMDSGADEVYLSSRSWVDPDTGGAGAPDGGNVHGQLLEENGNSTNGESIGEESNSERSRRTAKRVRNVQSFNADSSVTFEGGVRIEHVDVVIYATGYIYRFPFLEGTVAEQGVDDNHVTPLYRHVFPPRWAPTLAFIGLPWKVVPFPQFELQSRWVARALSGRVALPSEPEMLADVDAFNAWLEAEGVDTRHAHRMAGELQSTYNAFLCEASGVAADKGWPRWRAQLYQACGASRRANGLGYRDVPMEAADALEAAAAEAAAVRAAAAAASLKI